MSRIGKLPVAIPSGVNVDIKDGLVTVKGPKGQLSQQLDSSISATIEDGHINFARSTDDKEQRSLHGLYRSLVHNMVVGVSEGFKKQLELVGVGYRATAQNNILELALGFSHAIYIQLPPEVKVEAVTDRKSNPIITLESADKQLLGQICAKIRSFRMPEPYKGKGIKFVGEQIRRKAGKSAKAGA
ncbi:MAG: 50S ribosomal protein L6 [Bacteroidales bacterium]|nr:50S ribosomal protein L6 [Bacteroidales bacterium]